ncbi:glutamate racemase [Dysgonomonas sp. PH5-45]|uniref:glutamate racemase n=1 Tax=unclassified Dysgonomonas TaxID=2630389 RepID=UPI0024770835|nr:MULTISPECIES: glutamate racemase [unclassified Dysgonomonas]MDH6353865.1 glutamate racemase [Dysgonomonas sp. PH5-45]MDH6386768.1 glutamate racemase [Dysgonomonas sp. PH5-37]
MPLQKAGPIGVFDSGYGGLTILSEIKKRLPGYDYIYLGDNSRAPYGSRSFDVVYEFTRQAVETLFDEGCNLVILACNTASAKALRTIQQNDLPKMNPDKRVLGIIRPTAEVIGSLSQSRHVGVLGTLGTIQSGSYRIEIEKLHPDMVVTGEACPMWVPLVENNEYRNEGADYFVKKNLDNLFNKDALIDSIILGCTHYPLLLDKIRTYIPQGVNIISQGEYVAASLENYLIRHPEIEQFCTKNGQTQYFTTEAPERFTGNASIFLDENIEAKRINLG